MIEFFKEAISAPGFSVVSIIALLGLGFVGSIAATCCNIGIIGVVAGVAGQSGQAQQRKQLIMAVIFFSLGSVIALTAIGMIAAYINRLFTMTMATYWNLIAGLLLVFFGLVTLGISPIKLPKLKTQTNFTENKILAAGLGFIIGGALAAGCSLCCNPLFLAVLSFAAAKANVIIGGLLVTIYAIGYTIPVALAMLGIGLGTQKLNTYKAISKTLTYIVGAILIITGFYLLIPK